MNRIHERPLRDPVRPVHKIIKDYLYPSNVSSTKDYKKVERERGQEDRESNTHTIT